MVIEASGPVPRVLVPGVVWCEKAEARYVETAQAHLDRLGDRAADPSFQALVHREAKWAVEIALHQEFVKSRFQEAGLCRLPHDKRSLVARWREAYGNERTDRLLSMLRHDKLREAVLGGW